MWNKRVASVGIADSRNPRPIRIAISATSLIEPFQEIYWLELLMSGKKLSQFVQTVFFWEKITQEHLDGMDVDSFLYHNNFSIFQSQHRIAGVSKGSNKKSFAIKLFHFCYSETQQRYVLEEVNSSKDKLGSFVDGMRNFPKTMDQASKSLQLPVPKPKIEIGSTNSNKNLFTHY